jgi:hydroxymethylpyrimidine/phosphomethylpyrimidine kinase
VTRATSDSAPESVQGSRPATAMTIAGSDPSGGAGIQADLKTFSALGVYGTACLSALTSQNTVGVREVMEVPAAFCVSQIEAVIDDLPVDATKIGMLGGAETVRAVARTIAARRGEFGTLVLDPVMVATSGDALMGDGAARRMLEELVPLADVVTPNLPEAASLLAAEEPEDLAGMREAAAQLLGLGPRAVLLKGGHLRRGDAVDVLAIAREGAEPLLTEWSVPRVETRNTHGTGCTLSSAIAAHAARSRTAGRAASSPAELDDAALTAAVRSGKEFLTRALAEGAGWRLSRTPEAGHGPVDHLAQILR